MTAEIVLKTGPFRKDTTGYADGPLPLELDRARMAVSAVLSTPAVDRDGDIVVPTGVLTDQHRRNPVGLWNHNQNEPVIRWADDGGAYTITADDGGLRGVGYFAQSSQKGQELFRLYDEKVLRAFSIGFIAKRADRRDPDDDGPAGSIIHESELMEVSAVAVGANRDALAFAVFKGMVKDEQLRVALAPLLPEKKAWAPGATLADAERADATPKSVKVAAVEKAAVDSEPHVAANDDEEPEDDAPTDLQCVVLSQQDHGDESAAADWLDGRGYAADAVQPGDMEEARQFVGDARVWQAIQFEAAECEPDTAELRQLTEGAAGVFCRRRASDFYNTNQTEGGSDVAEQKNAAGQPWPALDGKPMDLTPGQYTRWKAGVALTGKLSEADAAKVAAVKAMDGGDEPMQYDLSEMDDNVECKPLTGAHAKAMHLHCKALEGIAEHPDMAPEHKSVCKAACKCYKDALNDMVPDEEDGEDGDEGTEEDKAALLKMVEDLEAANEKAAVSIGEI